MKIINRFIVVFVCTVCLNCTSEQYSPTSMAPAKHKYGPSFLADTTIVPPDSTLPPADSIPVPVDSIPVPPDTIPTPPPIIPDTVAVQDTIVLYRSGGFGGLKQFHNISNSTPDELITIYASGIEVILGGDGIDLRLSKLYLSPIGANSTTGVTDLVLTRYVFDDPNSYTWHPVPEDTIVLNMIYSHYTTYSRSGRGQHYTTHWILESGSIIRTIYVIQ